MRSTNAGIPASVPAISASSSWAGTTTATRLPSSTLQAPLHDRLPQQRGQRAQEEADQPAHDDRIARRARARLERNGALVDPRTLDVSRKCKQGPGVLSVLLDDRALLLEIVELADEHELIERRLVCCTL